MRLLKLVVRYSREVRHGLQHDSGKRSVVVFGFESIQEELVAQEYQRVVFGESRFKNTSVLARNDEDYEYKGDRVACQMELGRDRIPHYTINGLHT